MFIVLAQIAGPPDHYGDTLRGAVWDIALPADRLLHVYAQPGPHGWEIALFVHAPSLEAAVRTGIDLCQRACAQHLGGALLRRCEAVPITR